MYTIGIDVGGTFTDFVVASEGQPPRFFKTHSTPHDPSIGLMAGLSEAAEAHGRTLGEFIESAGMVIHERAPKSDCLRLTDFETFWKCVRA